MNKIELKKTDRVLLVHPFGIGDALFLTPVIGALHDHGLQTIDLWLGSRTRELFEHHPFVNHIFEWDKTRTQGASAWLKRQGAVLQMLWAIFRNPYDVLLDFSLGRQYSLLSWLLFWIPIRVGFDFKGRGTFLTHRVALPNAFSEKPVVEYYLDLIRLSLPASHCHCEELPRNDDGLSVSCDVYLCEDDHKECNALLDSISIKPNDSFVVVSPGGGASWGKDARLRRWPVRHFAALLERLKAEGVALTDHVVILGGAHDTELCWELEALLSGMRVHNLCGQTTSVRVTAALFKRARLFLANDSGLVHVAHAVGTPLVALYGPVNPDVYGPYPKTETALAVTSSGPQCRPCYAKMRYNADCVGVECLTELTAEQVMNQVRTQLNHVIARPV